VNLRLIIKSFSCKKIGLVVLSNSQALEAITAFKPGPFQERHSDEKTICDFFILAYFLPSLPDFQPDLFELLAGAQCHRLSAVAIILSSSFALSLELSTLLAP